jgi:hypothetical protein
VPVPILLCYHVISVAICAVVVCLLPAMDLLRQLRRQTEHCARRMFISSNGHLR